MSSEVEQASMQLIDLVYACLLGDAGWQFFLDRLSGILPGGKSVFMFHDTVRNAGMFSLTSGIDQRVMTAYQSHFAARNPWVQHVMTLPVGVGIVSDRMSDRSELLKSEFYSDYLPMIESKACIGIQVMREPTRSFMISTMTSQADSNLNAPGASVLTYLQPHLKRAFGYYRNTPVPSRSEQTSMLDAAGIGLVLVGPSSKMMSANATATEMLDAGEVCVAGPTGRLSMKNEAADTVMRRMLAMGSIVPRHHCYYAPTAKGRAKVTLVRLNKDPVAEFFAGPTVAVLIDVMRLEAGEISAALASRFGLTPAEARLAEALERGASLKEAAAAFGISEGTARQQLKSVFRKTGVARQSDLIRSMYESSFAPGR
jgi:DNA-binding CsgD family transcriptional regulator